MIICHGCGQAGHKKVECALQRVSNAHLCYVPRPSQMLGEAGQNIDTVVPVKIGGKQFMALVDTGSSQTLVREECVRDLHMSGQGKLRVRCVHGDEREYATVDLKMEVEGQPYLLTVGIVDKAPYAVILGRDVPVLVDLLQRQTGEADVRVVTRAKAKQVEEHKQTLNLLPFAKEPKGKRSRREKRKEKVRGTVIAEQLPEPDKNDLYDIPHNMSDLQKQDVTLEVLFQKAGSSHSRNRLQDKERFVVIHTVCGTYVLRMREKMDSMAELVHITMAKSQQQQKSWYDQSSRQRTLTPGQKVLLLLPTSDSGLLAKWQGPYEILRKVGPVNYELYLPDRRKKNQVFHINLLKPWQDRSGPLSDQLFAQKIDEEEESNEQYFPTAMSFPIFPELSHLTSEQQENLQLWVQRAFSATDQVEQG